MNLFKFILLILMLQFCAGYVRYVPFLKRYRRHAVFLEPRPVVLLRPRRYIPVNPYWASLRSQITMLDDDMMDNDQRGGGGGRGNNNKANMISDTKHQQKATNVAEKAADIAEKAAEDAKSAMDAQASAGQEASRHVKVKLAEKALQSAKAADAALAAKQQIVEQLEQEVRQAQIVVQQETSSLEGAQANVQAATQAAKQSQEQLRSLTNVAELAHSNVGYAEQAANGAQAVLTQKTSLLEAAKNRAEVLMRQLSAAKEEFKMVKQAAYQAAASAYDAKINASRN